MLSQDDERPGLVDELPLRMLANLGDGVISLYERERAIVSCASARWEPIQVKHLLNLVRRARNLKSAHRSSDQAFYRKATAFETLIGYLYMADARRLTELLAELDRKRTLQLRQSES